MTEQSNADEVLRRVETFLGTVFGHNEMNVVRGVRKAIAGEKTDFNHEVRLSVYGPPCGHTPPAHYPEGYGQCDPCRYGYETEDEDDEDDRW